MDREGEINEEEGRLLCECRWKEQCYRQHRVKAAFTKLSAIIADMTCAYFKVRYQTKLKEIDEILLCI